MMRATLCACPRMRIAYSRVKPFSFTPCDQRWRRVHIAPLVRVTTSPKGLGEVDLRTDRRPIFLGYAEWDSAPAPKKKRAVPFHRLGLRRRKPASSVTQCGFAPSTGSPTLGHADEARQTEPLLAGGPADAPWHPTCNRYRSVGADCAGGSQISGAHLLGLRRAGAGEQLSASGASLRLATFVFREYPESIRWPSLRLDQSFIHGRLQSLGARRGDEATRRPLRRGWGMTAYGNSGT